MENSKIINTDCFGKIDVRGVYPQVVNEELAYRIGCSFPALFNAKKVVVGHDIRLSGNDLQTALMNGLTDAGCSVINIGQCGTEMIYFATFHLKLDGGIMITASHNPKEYNGFKFVKADAVPISSDSGLKDIASACANEEYLPIADIKGNIEQYDIMPEYIQHILSYIDVNNFKPLKVVTNTGNGAAGPVIEELEKYLPLEFIKVNITPDGNFPNGVPNPILSENREATAKVVRENNADIGIAWDGDFDRCFLFDEKGNMIEGYYMVGFLAEAFLQKNKGAKIIHDPRVYWNTQDICNSNGGEAVLSKSGHSFIKEKMRQEDAIYGGEMSAHHYFKDFSYCDSGMIPWLLVLELLSISKKSMSEMMSDRMSKYPCSGEINSKAESVEMAAEILQAVEKKYSAGADVDYTDGLSIAYDNWRFNLRKSNTEPVIRLNVETKGDKELLREKTQELLSFIRK
jgi:phosphomannomutase